MSERTLPLTRNTTIAAALMSIFLLFCRYYWLDGIVVFVVFFLLVSVAGYLLSRSALDGKGNSRRLSGLNHDYVFNETDDYMKCVECGIPVKAWEAWRTPRKIRLCERCFGNLKTTQDA